MSMAPPRSAFGVLAGRAGPVAQPFGRHKRQAVCVRPQPPQGGAASGPAEPDPRRLLDVASPGGVGGVAPDSQFMAIEAERAERRATIGQRPMVLGRHGQSAGTARVRPQFTKPARLPTGAEPGRVQSGGLFAPGEELGPWAQRGLQGRPAYSPDEGLT